MKGPWEVAENFPEKEFICAKAKCIGVPAGKKL
jgi:hypothetical protein